MNDVVIWIQAASTVALLLVTGYYAKKTKDMADSAERSVGVSAKAASAAEVTAKESARASQASERSAEAARDAALVAHAQVKPDFRGHRVAAKNLTDEGHTACLHIESTGDAVVVHRVNIVRAFKKSTMANGGGRIDVEGEYLQPWGLDTVLPRRLHEGETILMTHPDLADARVDPLQYFILHVEYGFDVEGKPVASRQIKIDETSKFIA